MIKINWKLPSLVFSCTSWQLFARSLHLPQPNSQAACQGKRNHESKLSNQTRLISYTRRAPLDYKNDNTFPKKMLTEERKLPTWQLATFWPDPPSLWRCFVPRFPQESRYYDRATIQEFIIKMSSIKRILFTLFLLFDGNSTQIVFLLFCSVQNQRSQTKGSRKQLTSHCR